MQTLDVASWIRVHRPISLLVALYVGLVAVELARAGY